MTTVPLFVELCAGTAALSLRLHKDGARPPVSRMGAKTGYADAILRVLGLHPGQRAERYLWCEPDPGVRLLLHAYRDATLAKAAAAIIRGWKDEDPRALWERLRAEGPPRLPEGEVYAGEVARWSWLMVRSVAFKGPAAGYMPGGAEDGSGRWVNTQEGVANKWTEAPALPATIAPDARDIDPREVARFAQIVASNRLINTAWSDAEGRWINTGHGGATFGGPTFASPPERTADGLDAAPADLPAVVAPDAREVDPREVARGLWLSKRTWQDGKSFKADIRVNPCADMARAGRAWMPDDPAPAVDALPHLAAALIHPDARDIDPPTLPPGTVAYLDGPYENTTPYANLLPRAEQIVIARRWAEAGATVAISEAEPIPELVAEGWYSVEITNQRMGQKRTFSKQQAEWLTINRRPLWVPPVQGSLFG